MSKCSQAYDPYSRIGLIFLPPDQIDKWVSHDIVLTPEDVVLKETIREVKSQLLAIADQGAEEFLTDLQEKIYDLRKQGESQMEIGRRLDRYDNPRTAFSCVNIGLYGRKQRKKGKQNGPMCGGLIRKMNKRLTKMERVAFLLSMLNEARNQNVKVCLEYLKTTDPFWSEWEKQEIK
jgi:hypothetical protein